MDKPIQEDEWWVNNIDIYILANQIMQTKPPRWMAVVVVMGLKIESGKRLLGFSSTNFCVFHIWMNVFLILCLTHSWPEYKVEIWFAFRNRRPFTDTWRVPDCGQSWLILYSFTKITGVELWDWNILVSADDISCLQHGADSCSSGILKSDAIVVHFTPQILQKLITWLATEPF